MLDTVIVIPYRAREKDLEYFLANSVPLLQKHIPNGKVVIVEQDWTHRLFNRGCLLNIGVKEYENKTIHAMTHDVDINPKEETILKYYIDPIPDNTIKGIYTSVYNTLGGIIKFRLETFFKINGFQNLCWGWGGEDKILQNRAEQHKINIFKNIINVGKRQYQHFTIFENQKDKQVTFCPRGDKSGLNNLKYTILEKQDINDYVELIKVSI